MHVIRIDMPEQLNGTGLEKVHEAFKALGVTKYNTTIKVEKLRSGRTVFTARVS